MAASTLRLCQLVQRPSSSRVEVGPRRVSAAAFGSPAGGLSATVGEVGGFLWDAQTVDANLGGRSGGPRAAPRPSQPPTRSAARNRSRPRVAVFQRDVCRLDERATRAGAPPGSPG